MKYFHIISFLLPFSLNVYLNSSQQNSKQQCIYYYFSCNSHSLYYNIHIKGHFTRFFGTMSNNLILIPYYYFVLFAYLFYSTDMCLSSTCFTKFYMSSIWSLAKQGLPLMECSFGAGVGENRITDVQKIDKTIVHVLMDQISHTPSFIVLPQELSFLNEILHLRKNNVIISFKIFLTLIYCSLCLKVFKKTIENL